ncbi:MAG: hypothetical protein ACYCSP_07435 [Acidobacteriaceae bacterium]
MAGAAGLIVAVTPSSAQHRLHIGIGAFSYRNLSIDDMILQLNALRIRRLRCLAASLCC